MILIALAHTCATLQGQIFKQQGVQAYIIRPESLGASHKRHSAFRVGLSAYRWVSIGDTVLQQLAVTLMQLTPNKLPEYQRGQ